MRSLDSKQIKEWCDIKWSYDLTSYGTDMGAEYQACGYENNHNIQAKRDYDVVWLYFTEQFYCYEKQMTLSYSEV